MLSIRFEEGICLPKMKAEFPQHQRKSFLCREIRHWLNGVLRKHCSANGLHLFENDDIVLRPHGHHDGVHLNRAGSDVLSRNLLFTINNVD